MSWEREWRSIDLLIAELFEIGKDHISALRVQSFDELGTMKNIIVPMIQDIDQRISEFKNRYYTQLPVAALKQLEDFIGNPSFESAGLPDTSGNSPTAVSYLMGMLRRFRADFNYLTSDLEGVVVSRTARAFVHLQRSIVVDSDLQKRWNEAYQQDETMCEKLGAVHLLLHGIWAFKAHSAGERTDLVLGEPLDENILDDVYLSAEGLVLTEWKMATQRDYRAKFQEALSQATAYGSGSLAPIELKSYRYLVVVSEDYLPHIEDRLEGGVVYKYINLAVKPSSPSIRARRGT